MSKTKLAVTGEALEVVGTMTEIEGTEEMVSGMDAGRDNRGVVDFSYQAVASGNAAKVKARLKIHRRYACRQWTQAAT